MFSQITWLQFLLFCTAAAFLWYMYVFIVYYRSSVSTLKLGKQPAAPTVAPQVSVAKRSISTSAPIQTETIATVVPAVAVPQAAESDGNEDRDLDEDQPVDEMSPAAFAALKGEGFNWEESPAMSMDYREPDEDDIQELEDIDVRTLDDGDDEEEDPDSGDVVLPAEDHITTIRELVKPQMEAEQVDVVLSAVQRSVGSISLLETAQRNVYAGKNIAWAFDELTRRGELSAAHQEFRDRFFASPGDGSSAPATIAPEDYTTLLQSIT